MPQPPAPATEAPASNPAPPPASADARRKAAPQTGLPPAAALQALARRFVWLLRDDVRKALASPGTAATPADLNFQRWWLLKGRAEYPAWNGLNEHELAWLAEKSVQFEIGPLRLALPRALGQLLQYRSDVVQQYSRGGALDRLAAAGWFFALGLDEHQLHGVVDLELVRSLDKPLPGADTSRSEVPAVTVLMRMIWQLLDERLHAAMPLDTDAARARFMAWFFAVACSRFKLGPLLASRWRHWLLQEVALPGRPEVRLPRFAFQAIELSPALQARFDFDRADGLQQARDWAQRTQRSGGHWAWLHDKTRPGQAPMLPLAAGQADGHAAGDGARASTGRAADKPFGLNLFGFAFGELGIGEDLRMAVAACEAAQIPYRVVNIDAGSNLRQADATLQQQVEAGRELAPYAINLFCMPGFDTVSRVFLRMGAAVFEGHYNIGWWPWELSVWPAAWQPAFDLVDEIWAGSEFARAMYARSTRRPLQLMPLAVKVASHPARSRSDFGLPGRAFLFLYVFDFNSWLARKNPMAAVAAFRLAFPASDRKVRLVLKVMNGRDHDPAWQDFVHACHADERITLLTETLDRPDVLALIEVCDAYVSLHRAEGFGRTLAEAMLFGKPVVATGYSGNVDFMHPELSFAVDYTEAPIRSGEYAFVEDSDAAVWAEPSVSDAAAKMRQARARAGKKGFAAAVRQHAEQCFAPERVGGRMAERLRVLAEQQGWEWSGESGRGQ